MERAFRVSTAVLLFVFGVLYIAAKIHFFTRFGATDLHGYIAEHWPYSAGLAAIAALVWVISRLSGRNGEDTPEKGSPTTG